MSDQPTLIDVDPYARRDADFYETFKWQSAVLFQRVPLDGRWTYLEPCAGNGAIVRPLVAHIPVGTGAGRILANDIIQREYLLDMQRDATTRESWEAFERHLGQIDVTVTNLPFNVAFEVLQLALEFSKVAVITLLRHTWDEPTLDRHEWLWKHPLTAKIVMPRAKYRKTAQTESATHSWFIWWQHPAWPTLGKMRPHETVTIGECVEYAQSFKEDISSIAGATEYLRRRRVDRGVV